VPGPGEYDPLRSLSALRDKSKGARMSRSKRENFSMISANLPGPGHYDDPSLSVSKFKNPSYDFTRSPERGKVNTKLSIDIQQ